MQELTGKPEIDIVNLYDQYIALRRELNDMLYNLDDDNMRKITAKSIETSTLIVGDNIAMGPNATIAWGNVSGVPNDIVYSAVLEAYPTEIELATALASYTTNSALANALVGYITTGVLSTTLALYLTNGQFSTLIGRDYIVTGKIAANQIAAGRIDAAYIATDISQVNAVLSLGGGYGDFSSITFDGNGGIEALNGILEFSALTNMDFSTNVSFGMNVNFYWSADFSSASVDGLENSGYATKSYVDGEIGDCVRPYYLANICYLDAGASSLIIRDTSGTTIGTITYD